MIVLALVPSGRAHVSPQGAASFSFPHLQSRLRKELKWIPNQTANALCPHRPTGAALSSERFCPPRQRQRLGPAERAQPCRNSSRRSSEEKACCYQHTAHDRKRTVSPLRARGVYGQVSCCRLRRLGEVCCGKREVCFLQAVMAAAL